jgi:hypothetical protein
MNRVSPSCTFVPLGAKFLPQNSCDPDHTTDFGMDIQFLAGCNPLRTGTQRLETAVPALLWNERQAACI